MLGQKNRNLKISGKEILDILFLRFFSKHMKINSAKLGYCCVMQKQISQNVLKNDECPVFRNSSR